MKNVYYNGWCVTGTGINDGHDWGEIPDKPYWDGAQCKDCGVVASNAEIASGVRSADRSVRVPACTVPVEAA